MQPAFVHIGHGKTGTSAIQAWLARNGKALRKHGFHYLSAGRVGDQHWALAPLGTATIDEEVFAAARREVTEFEQLGPIVSSEALYYVKPATREALAALFAGRRVNLILFVRPQDYMIPSAYMQALRANRSTIASAVDYFKLHRAAYLYHKAAQGFLDALPDSSLTVRFYREGRGFDAVSAFGEIVGIDACDTFAQRVNASVPSRLAEVLRIINESDLDDEWRNRLLAAMARVDFKPTIDPEHDLFPAQLQEIRTFYWEDNQRIAEFIRDEDERRAFLLAVSPDGFEVSRVAVTDAPVRS